MLGVIFTAIILYRLSNSYCQFLSNHGKIVPHDLVLCPFTILSGVSDSILFVE